MHRLHEYIKDGKSIYVRNLSGDHPDEITKLIMLEIKPLNGPSRTIKIPPVDPPITLSAMVSPPHILGESQDLLELINNEVLELVDPEEAIEELKDERAQRIVQKAHRDIHNRAAFDPRNKKPVSKDGRRKVPKRGRSEDDMSGGKNPLKKLMQDAADGIDSELPEIKLSPADQAVSGVILEMCAMLVADPSTAENVVEDLDVMPEGDISDADLGHLIKHSMAKKVSDWAQQQLVARGMEEEYEDEEEEEEDYDDAADEERDASSSSSHKKKKKSGGGRKKKSGGQRKKRR